MYMVSSSNLLRRLEVFAAETAVGCIGDTLGAPAVECEPCPSAVAYLTSGLLQLIAIVGLDPQEFSHRPRRAGLKGDSSTTRFNYITIV